MLTLHHKEPQKPILFSLSHHQSIKIWSQYLPRCLGHQKKLLIHLLHASHSFAKTHKPDSPLGLLASCCICHKRTYFISPLVFLKNALISNRKQPIKTRWYYGKIDSNEKDIHNMFLVFPNAYTKNCLCQKIFNLTSIDHKKKMW